MKLKKLLPAGSLLALLLTTACSTQKNATEQRAEIEFQTTKGTFAMALFNETPLHRDAYLLLAKCGFFDSLLIHRTINNFVVQGGDPTSRHAPAGALLGDGDPFSIPPEIHYPALHHTRGMVNAAREADDTNPRRLSCGSQFAIITTGPLTDTRIDAGEALARKWQNDPTFTIPDSIKKQYREIGGAPHLDNQYTVFAQIIEGMDVVDSSQSVKTDKNDRPLEDIRILKATVRKDYIKMTPKKQKK
jgi:peptidyl-prolyl cis-trans isomerase B (cyclophilin B)